MTSTEIPPFRFAAVGMKEEMGCFRIVGHRGCKTKIREETIKLLHQDE